MLRPGWLHLSFSMAFAAFAAGAHAACPQALAVYAEPASGATIEFRPLTQDSGFAVTNEFRLTLGRQPVEGMVLWTDDPARSVAIVTHNCPEGDVTGAEIEACMVWEGVIYALGADGAAGLLPPPDQPAAASLLLADFGRSVRGSAIYAGEGGLAAVPFDQFFLSGCQE